jgi:hypothetical protein
MNEDRILLAEEFLREAVFKSRHAQAALPSSRALRPPRMGPAQEAGNCGLGERAAIVLALSGRGQELFESLFGAVGEDPGWDRVRSAMTEWIERQDALDRKRNHFLKEFRGRHGADRTKYASEIVAEFEAGLARINAEEDAARRAVAGKLLSLDL